MIIRDKDKTALQAIFATANEPIEVWAYGSRVNGRAHSGSDLDLVIRSESLKPIAPDLFMELFEKIDDSTIPILVELRDWAKLPDSFQNNIQKQYEVLYSNMQLQTPSVK